jgi:hypothetical protein
MEFTPREKTLLSYAVFASFWMTALFYVVPRPWGGLVGIAIVLGVSLWAGAGSRPLPPR